MSTWLTRWWHSQQWGGGTTGTPLHKGSEAQPVEASQTSCQTLERESACAYVCANT